MSYYTFDYEFENILLECKLEIIHGEKGSRVDGLQFEPDIPDNMVLFPLVLGQWVNLVST
jgi:hypothetical protein